MSTSAVFFILVMACLALLPMLLVGGVTIFSRRLWQSTHRNINQSLADQWQEIDVIGQDLGLTSQLENEELLHSLQTLPDFRLSKSRSLIPYSLKGGVNEVDFWILFFGGPESYDQPDSFEITFQGLIYLFMQSETLDLPIFSLKNASLWPFSKSIKLKGNAQFSRKYQIKGANRQAVRDFFNPQLVNFLADQPRSLSLRGNGNILIYGKGWRNLNCINTAAKINAVVEEGLHLHNLISRAKG
ncbi:MAG: hypothetical protein AAF827_03235 [Cyanobacteria bacterium P01_D01_bin.6]